jgi:hypothetical protein
MQDFESRIAQELSEIGDLGQGTLAFLTIRKKGLVRGAQGEKATYDNDKVQVLLWAGFHYKTLVGRSYNRLHEIWDRGTLFQSLLTATRKSGYAEVTLKDVSEAVQELNDALLKVLNGVGCAAETFVETPQEEEASQELDYEVLANPRTWEPLIVDGLMIKGAKVYAGRTERIAQGTIYLDGVKLGEKIIETSTHWEPSRKPKTIAKDILRSWLPVGLYVRYCLSPDNLEEIKVGELASAAAKQAQILIEPEALRSLFKIAL